MPKDTSIGIDNDTWKRLNSRKGPGDSFEEVINRALDRLEELEDHADQDETSDQDYTKDVKPIEQPELDRDKLERILQENPLSENLKSLVDEIAITNLPGSGEKLEARKKALHAAVVYLKEQKQATPTDFQRDIYPHHTAYYTGGENPAYSWWTNCIYKGLSELANRTDTIEAADTSGRWTYTDESTVYDPTNEF